MPTVIMQKMRLLWRALPLPLSTHVNNGASMVDPDSFLHTPLVAVWTTLQHLQAVSKQPTPVLFLGLSAAAQVSVPNLHTHQQTLVLV